MADTFSGHHEHVPHWAQDLQGSINSLTTQLTDVATQVGVIAAWVQAQPPAPVPPAPTPAPTPTPGS